MPYSAGSSITASDINVVKDRVNATLSRYGVANVPNLGTVGNNVLSSHIETLRANLATCNNSSLCVTKSDLSVITNYTAGTNVVLAQLLNTIEAKATEIYNNYCSCQCNYCTCNCNYSCTCNCNYSCTCNCNNCSCNCNNCSCNCNYSCTCNCNYSCTCNCNYSCTCQCNYCSCQCNYTTCSCNCNNCSCYCNYTGTCAQYTCLLPDQMLYTSSGMKRAKDIETGDYLLVHDGTYEEVFTKWEMMNRREKIGVIKGQSFELRVTDDHPIYVYSEQEGAVVKADASGLSMMEDLSGVKGLLPKMPKNRANFDENDTFFYKQSLQLLQPFAQLMPYLLLRTSFDGTDYVIHFEEDEHNLMIRAASHLEHGLRAHFTDKDNNLHVFGDQYISNIPVGEVIRSVTEHGIPNWFFNYTDITIRNFVEELGLVAKDRDMKSVELAYQVRMLLAQLGIEAKVEDTKISILGKMQTYKDFFLMDIVSVEIEEFMDLIYNFVMNEKHSYVGEILVGDGFECP